jgi:hypothetical protein
MDARRVSFQLFSEALALISKRQASFLGYQFTVNFLRLGCWLDAQFLLQ